MWKSWHAHCDALPICVTFEFRCQSMRRRLTLSALSTAVITGETAEVTVLAAPHVCLLITTTARRIIVLPFGNPSWVDASPLQRQQLLALPAHAAAIRGQQQQLAPILIR
jgi:hypothetical protein